MSKKREEIDSRYKWKLTDLFETDELWEKEYHKVLELADRMLEYQGKIGTSAMVLWEALSLYDELTYHTERVFVYANQSYHQDTQVSKYQGASAQCDSLMTKVREASSFMAPEILGITDEALQSFFEEEPKLEAYRRAIDVIRRDKDHILSNEAESMLAAVSEVSVAAYNIYSMLNNADMKFPSITGKDGEEIQVTHGNFTTLLTDTDREIRKAAYESLYGEYDKLGNTIAATFLAQLKKEKFYATQRKFSSVRAKHLSEGNIPESVYDNLIETVHKHLPAMHRYVSLRKKILGLEELHMYDLFVPLVSDVERKYTIEEAEEIVAEALAPMGEEYVSVLRDSFKDGWIDVYENENKRSGAYSWGGLWHTSICTS